MTSAFTVNSCYCGNSRDRDLVSVLPRVRNSGVRDSKADLRRKEEGISFDGYQKKSRKCNQKDKSDGKQRK